MNNKFITILLVIIISLIIPDLIKLGTQLITKLTVSTPNHVKIQFPSPSPNPQTINPANKYTSKELQISFTLPEGNFTINYDKTKDWGAEFGTKYAFTKHIRIEDLQSRQLYDIDLASIENDKPFAWEGAPSWYVPALSENESTEELLDKLTKYMQNPIYIKNIYLDNLNSYAKIVYTKSCYGPCKLYRKYLIPFEKSIDGKIYHTLTFSTVIGELGFGDEEVNSNLETLKRLIPLDQFSDPEAQQAIKIQDQITHSLVIK